MCVRACMLVHERICIAEPRLSAHFGPTYFGRINKMCVLVNHGIRKQFTVCLDLFIKMCGLINKTHY